MGQNVILIHEDGDVPSNSAHKLRKMESRRQMVRVPDDEDELQELDDEETSSEASIETEDDVDESVAEDMRKLEESFKGISTRYRLINRIGEGEFGKIRSSAQLISVQAPSQRSTRLRRFLKTMKMSRTIPHMTLKNSMARCRRQRNERQVQRLP